MNWQTTMLVTALLGSCICAYGAERTTGVSERQWENALRNGTTAPSYVLVTVVDKRNGRAEDVCVFSFSLVHALVWELGLRGSTAWEHAIRHALAQKSRRFEFTNPQALRNLSRPYTEEVLREVRQFLAEYDTAEIKAMAKDQQSALYRMCRKKPGSFGTYFPAAGHALLERGIPCGQSCLPGLIYIGEIVHNKAAALAPPAPRSTVPSR